MSSYACTGVAICMYVAEWAIVTVHNLAALAFLALQFSTAEHPLKFVARKALTTPREKHRAQNSWRCIEAILREVAARSHVDTVGLRKWESQ